MSRRNIIIGDGLTNEFVSPEVQFRQRQANVGTREIERLMGASGDFGNGPVPTFLKSATEKPASRGDIRLIVLRDVEGEGTADGFGTGGTDFPDVLKELLSESEVVPCSRDMLPFQAFSAALEHRIGVSALANSTRQSNVHFMVLGCHTEKRIATIATFLRNVLGFKYVAVCSHLVGSAIREAHFSCLMHGLPKNGVKIFLDLVSAAKFVGVDPNGLPALGRTPCEIMPSKARRGLGAERRHIVESLCMHWTKAELIPLQGGYTGSLLFLANGFREGARVEPMVLKVDEYSQMRREIDGYQEVKDLLGKNVPTFTFPITIGNTTGVGMELAAMEGRPETLQDSFEVAEGEVSTNLFMQRLDKALELLRTKLYRNTALCAWVAPYRRLGLHTQQQYDWFEENSARVMSDAASAKITTRTIPPENIQKLLKLVASNEDGVESDVCLVHGDLNLKNIICDEADNVWFIDWTHSGWYPIELDYAKVENDLKFVMSKQFENDDLERLGRFEEYLVETSIPVDAQALPESLSFVKWDLRFRKILDAVRRVRQSCFSLKANKDDCLVYRIALLRYALHTLSFDQRRARGECGLTQLLYALKSVEHLVFTLAADDFHLKIRSERPSSYPTRFRIPIDEALWAVPCPSYSPPYHVDAVVLANNLLETPGGWADPEDVSLIPPYAVAETVAQQDEVGRPLNPRGRTGIEGRGLLGKWGPNRMVGIVITRINPEANVPEVVLKRSDHTDVPNLPKGFVDADVETALTRVFHETTGWCPREQGQLLREGYAYDPRQTDNAWVELEGRLYHLTIDEQSRSFRPASSSQDVEWWPLEPGTLNSLSSSDAELVRKATRQLAKEGVVERNWAEGILAKTG